jgi:hypothetical protein
VSETRNCTSGSLSGSYTNASCTFSLVTCLSPSDFTDTTDVYGHTNHTSNTITVGNAPGGSQVTYTSSSDCYNFSFFKNGSPSSPPVSITSGDTLYFVAGVGNGDEGSSCTLTLKDFSNNATLMDWKVTTRTTTACATWNGPNWACVGGGSVSQTTVGSQAACQTFCESKNGSCCLYDPGSGLCDASSNSTSQAWGSNRYSTPCN